jgi:hypothetical protein
LLSPNCRSSSRIIIDLSENGGGSATICEWLVELVLGSGVLSPKSQRQNQYNFPADTDVVRALREEELVYYNWRYWFDTNEDPYTNGTKGQFFYPITEQTFGEGGFPGNYSSPFKFQMEYILDAFFPLPPAFGEKPLLLFSNGFCFSCCAFFAYSMNLKHGVPLAHVGGNPNDPTMAFSAGAIGTVSSPIDDFLYGTNAEIYNLTDAPRPLGIPGSLYMTIANEFLQQGPNVDFSVPNEYRYVPAAVTTNYTMASVEDFTLQWLDAAQAYWGN